MSVAPGSCGAARFQVLRDPVEESPQVGAFLGHQAGDGEGHASGSHAPQALEKPLGLGRQLQPGEPAVGAVGHPPEVAQLLQAVDERHQGSRRHAQALSELPAGLPAPSPQGGERAELRHGQVDVHEKPRGLVGESGMLPAQREHDGADVVSIV